MITPLNIVAPIGAFGNHLRWLLLLDPSFKISVGPNEYYYNEFAGPDWPDYEIYCKNNHTGISSNVLEEIKKSNQLHNFLNTVQYDTIDEKINFITNYVYSESRSWHNWLAIEWAYRDYLQDSIKFSHDLPKNHSQNNKIIGLTITPELALKMYLKFNSSFNNRTIPWFIKSVKFSNHIISKNPNISSYSSDQLFLETLDPELYAKIIDWAGLDNLYKEASHVHKLWYCLHKKSEQEFVQYVNQLYQ
jgi:hypothetical protein